jgi:FAD/FMN-containing dehydrogenase
MMNGEKAEILKELEGIVGKGYASTDKEDILPYTRDMMSRVLKAYDADYVVLPKTVEEVQGVVRLANKYKIPVYPYGRGASMTNAAAPRSGGMMMPMTRMNRVIEINERTRTATIEPGVSWSQLVYEANKKRLEPRTLPGGPHSGTPIGNYSIGGGPLGVLDVNEVVTLEAVS